MNKVDIYRAAQVLIKQEDDQASKIALERMTRFQENGDWNAATTWFEISCAVQDLQGREAAVIH